MPFSFCSESPRPLANPHGSERQCNGLRALQDDSVMCMHVRCLQPWVPPARSTALLCGEQLLVLPQLITAL